MAKIGRPPIYGAATRARVCELIASGKTIRQVAATPDLPSMAEIIKWRMNEPEFAAQYAHARSIQIEGYESEIIEISDSEEDIDNPKAANAAVQRARLRVDSRRWLLSKLKPHLYGDRLDLNHSGEVRLSEDQVNQRLAAILGAIEPGAKAGIVDVAGDKAAASGGEPTP